MAERDQRKERERALRMKKGKESNDTEREERGDATKVRRMCVHVCVFVCVFVCVSV